MLNVFNRCSTVHFDKYEIFLVQQMHYLLKHKILQLVFKCLKVHFSAPTCFGPLGPSSGSIQLVYDVNPLYAIADPSRTPLHTT
jgi:hypothetical protein